MSKIICNANFDLIFRKGDRVTIEGFKEEYEVISDQTDPKEVHIYIPGQGKKGDGIRLQRFEARIVKHVNPFTTDDTRNYRKEILTSTQKPKFSPVCFENIPKELQDRPRWLFWGAVQKVPPKWDKIPKIPMEPTRWGSKSISDQWVDFSEISERYQATNSPNEHIDGIYHVLGEGITGIDLDNCVHPETGEIKPTARRILDLLHTYCEFSPTGTGIKAYIACSKKVLWDRIGLTLTSNAADFPDEGMVVECYEDGAGFCVTGQQVPGYPTILSSDADKFFEAWNLAFRSMVDEERERQARVKAERSAYLTASTVPKDINDARLLEMARGAANGEKFARLYDAGDTSDYSNDSSRADFALVAMLAFWCGDDSDRIDALFEQSKLMRDKWKGSYRRSTLNNVLRNLGATYDWSGSTSVDLDDVLEKIMRSSQDHAEESYTSDCEVADEGVGESTAEPEPRVYDPKDYEAGDDPRKSAAPTGRRGFRPSEIRDFEDPVWLVQDHVQENTFGAIFGAPGSFKSFYALDLAFSIASGTKFLDRFAVKQGPVVYIYAEGKGGSRQRMMAWEQSRKLTLDDANLCVIPYTFNFSAEQDQEVEDLIKIASETLGKSPSAVIVDTLSRNFGSGDENATKDMKAFVDLMDKIRVRTEAVVMVVHHTGKDRSRKERGSNVLRASVDTLIEIERDTADSPNAVVACEKQKDGDPFGSYQVMSDRIMLERGGNSLVLQHHGEPLDKVKATQGERTKKSDANNLQIFHAHEIDAISVANAAIKWEIKTDAATKRLKDLYTRGLLTRKEDKKLSGGVAYLYYLSTEGYALLASFSDR